MPNKIDAAKKPKQVTWGGFLESVAPGDPREIADLIYHDQIVPIDIHKYCGTCRALTWFAQHSHPVLFEGDQEEVDALLRFRCKNCTRQLRIFAVRVTRCVEMIGDDDDPQFEIKGGDALVLKFGEIPSFVPPSPSRLLALLHGDVELLHKGQQSENQGLGIGAFVYYRRMVENHKRHLIDEIQKVAKKDGASPELVALYQQAAEQPQFTQAVETIKDSIPASLFISGKNPLLLLHAALSDGVHNLSDHECLERAHDIRVVLAELVNRISQTLKDESELKRAVHNLAQHRNKRATKKPIEP